MLFFTREGETERHRLPLSLFLLRIPAGHTA